MALETNTKVGKLKRVTDEQGDEHPPANSTEQEKTNDRLGNFPNGVDGDQTDDTTGSTLPSNAVPPGVEVAVQAKYGNTERVKVGLSSTPTVELQKGASVKFRVQNTDQIHVVAKSSGDGVNFTVESN